MLWHLSRYADFSCSLMRASSSRMWLSNSRCLCASSVRFSWPAKRASSWSRCCTTRSLEDASTLARRLSLSERALFGDARCDSHCQSLFALNSSTRREILSLWSSICRRRCMSIAALLRATALHRRLCSSAFCFISSTCSCLTASCRAVWCRRSRWRASKSMIRRSSAWACCSWTARNLARRFSLFRQAISCFRAAREATICCRMFSEAIFRSISSWAFRSSSRNFCCCWWR
mmetsp:Transcript_128428/g.221892  ORF Transcript_128428/g.221892 Transcript_128428/m.221892 type:complete len:232 (+) Transcript_128428:840-1535(+)